MLIEKNEIIEDIRRWCDRGAEAMTMTMFNALLDGYFQKHPYLYDNTIYCAKCGRPGVETECMNASWDEQWDGVAVEVYDMEELVIYTHICPTCDKELPAPLSVKSAYTDERSYQLDEFEELFETFDVHNRLE